MTVTTFSKETVGFLVVVKRDLIYLRNENYNKWN